MVDYEKALKLQIENEGSMSSERAEALRIANERLEKTKAERGF